MSANEMKHLILILTIFVITTLHTTSSQRSQFLRYVVKGDGSCLFSAVQYALRPGKELEDRLNIRFRKEVGEYVRDNPQLYEPALTDLRLTAANYPDFIANTAQWGGEIDLSALSYIYQKEIAVLNLPHKKLDRYGEDQDFQGRIYLVYDNNHYDTLYKLVQKDKPIQTAFPKGITKAFKEATILAKMGSPWQDGRIINIEDFDNSQ